MGGRKLSNTVKTRPLRQAEAALTHVQEAHPGRMRDAAGQLVNSIEVEATAARGAYIADPAPRLAGHREVLDRIAAELRTATDAHVHQVDATLARAQRAVAAGFIEAPSSARITAAMETTRAALVRTAGGSPLPVLCALAHAGPPVCPEGGLGAEYRAVALRATAHLDRISAAYAAALRGWSMQAVSRFTTWSGRLASAVDRDVAVYRDGALTALAELDAATATVRAEADKLGMATGRV
jgi:hypothetical protein